MLDWWIALIIGVAALLIGAVVAIVLAWQLTPLIKKNQAAKKAKYIIKDAEIKADHIVKKSELDVRQKMADAKRQAQEEAARIKADAIKTEAVLQTKEHFLSQRENSLNQKEKSLDTKNSVLEQRIATYEKKAEELDSKISDIISELEKVSGMSRKEAHDLIMSEVESKMAVEIASYIRLKEEEAEEQAEEKAKMLLSIACEKYAQDVTTERTVAVISLPTDELKGRIIGREGRNIKVLESTLGVDLVIDDTPEVITVSCFDPIKREIARRSLNALVKDGRIQPGRIEEVAQKMRKEVLSDTQKAGEEAAQSLGLPRINREILGHLGKLKYRTSYGQNVLDHSLQVAHLAGLMAVELGLDQNLAKRAGLLHDLGKAVDFEKEGSHVELGVELARKYNEPEVVVNSIESHHGDVEAKSVIAHLVAAADTLSAARPGARSDTLDNYVKRITQLEEIASGFEGVEKAYAVQAGREIRVMVIPEKVSDNEALVLAQKMREKIESEMTYPGQIKVSVIREYRAIETAK